MIHFEVTQEDLEQVDYFDLFLILATFAIRKPL